LCTKTYKFMWKEELFSYYQQNKTDKLCVNSSLKTL